METKPKNSFGDELDELEVTPAELLRREQVVLAKYLRCVSDRVVADQEYLAGSTAGLEACIVELGAEPFSQLREDKIADVEAQVKGLGQVMGHRFFSAADRVALQTLEDTIVDHTRPSAFDNEVDELEDEDEDEVADELRDDDSE